MTSFRRMSVVTIATCCLAGCTTQGQPLNSQQALEMTAAETPPETRRTTQRPGEDPQTAYRRELLNNQLRHARMDLQSASSQSERQNIQERIDLIERMLATLD